MKQPRFVADDMAIVRFPVLPAEVLRSLAAINADRLGEAVAVHLADPYVREAIYLASPSLYARLSAWESGGGSFNGIAQSIARYLLRMAFRATPFGTFSAIATCETGAEETQIAIPTRSSLHRSVQLDGSALSRLALRATEDHVIRDFLRYSSNDTLMFGEDAVVFIAFERNRRGRRVYRRVEIERSAHLDAAIEIVRDGLRVDEIVDALHRRFPQDATRDETVEFVRELVRAQILCCDQLVDITAENGLAPLLEHLPEDAALRVGIDAIDRIIMALSGTRSAEVPGVYADVVSRLAAMQVRADRDLPIKVDLYADSGSDLRLSQDTVATVERVVNDLVSFSPRGGKLRDFVKMFVERYGEAEVPLTVVADQLEALGFSDRDASLPALSRMVRKDKRAPKATSPGLGDRILEFAVEQWDQAYVDITHLVDSAPPRPAATHGETTVVAWFSLWTREESDAPTCVEIRSVGAQDPGRLMGRFAHVLPRIALYLRDAASRAPWPVVEIVHQPEDRLGNISARPRLSDFEIRLRGGAPREARRLPLDDLSVCVVMDRVVVRSKLLNGPIELRMSNAHAYEKQGNLPLYRFLNHVSNQGYAAELPSLRRRMPKAPHVPGLIYRGIIVCRPTWLLSEEDIARLRGLQKTELHAEFKALRVARGLPEWSALIQGDNVIPYHLDTDWMVDDLLKSAFRTGHALLTDTCPDGMRPMPQSVDGTHFHEMQITLRLKAGAAMPVRPAMPVSARDIVMPLWSQWAYFKLYCPSHLQDAVLAEVKPALDALIAESGIEGAYFVRYRDEQGAHLRLRLRTVGGAAAESSLAGLREVFDRLHRSGVLQSVAMVPYVREIARYGGESGIALCETLFCIDSRLVLEAIPRLNPGVIDFWRDAGVAVDALLLSFGMTDPIRRLAFARRAAADFAMEMRFETEERKRIGAIYAATGPLPIAANGAPDRGNIATARIFDDAIPVMADVWRMFLVATNLEDDVLYNVQWSLVHMRLNRIFNRDQRLQESIVWELLKRSYASAVNRNSTPGA